MSRFGSLGILVLVTPLLLAYGSSPWSWVGGPLAALAVWVLDDGARAPRDDPAPAVGATSFVASVDDITAPAGPSASP